MNRRAADNRNNIDVDTIDNRHDARHLIYEVMDTLEAAESFDVNGVTPTRRETRDNLLVCVPHSGGAYSPKLTIIHSNTINTTLVPVADHDTSTATNEDELYMLNWSTFPDLVPVVYEQL